MNIVGRTYIPFIDKPKSRFVEFHINEYGEKPCMSLELYGCKAESKQGISLYMPIPFMVIMCLKVKEKQSPKPNNTYLMHIVYNIALIVLEV